LRNWIDFVLPVLNAFFRPARICEIVLSNERACMLVPTHNRDLIYGCRSVRRNFQAGVELRGHDGS
jgi:hypothetical protein